jgi:hypothetical protein
VAKDSVCTGPLEQFDHQAVWAIHHVDEARPLKEIKLIEVSLDELGGEQPTVGHKATIHGVLYLIMEIQPPKTKSSKWRRKTSDDTEQKWRLLVQRV